MSVMAALERSHFFFAKLTYLFLKAVARNIARALCFASQRL